MTIEQLGVLDQIGSWLSEMRDQELLVLKHEHEQLVITAPNGAVVTIQAIGDRFDMSRVLLGTVFSLRIVRYNGQWYIEDRHKQRKELEPEAFYGELEELLTPPGPML
jgi:hypothetical protein